MAPIKYSHQREAILRYLHSTTSHPTAETIFANVRETCPNISLGTIYRNLSLLQELGTIQKIDCGDGHDHYDGNAAPHYHLYCKACHCVDDVHMPNMTELETLAGRYYDGAITGHSILFYGTCPDCTKKEAAMSQ